MTAKQSAIQDILQSEVNLLPFEKTISIFSRDQEYETEEEPEQWLPN